MTRTIIYSVAIHSCLLRFDVRVKDFVVAGEKYLSVSNDNKIFRLLPNKCSCRKQATRYEAEQLIETGRAEPIWKYKDRRMQIDDNCIWMAQQVKVPRIDLISKADIERAYTSDNPDVSEAAMEYIEEVHQMYMENRAKLIVPFKEEYLGDWPLPNKDRNGNIIPGRLLFPFSNDERTKGGYN